MSMLSYVKSNGKVRSVGDAAGTAEIPGRTELTRLHYYDGKFLRADDLRAEQDYHRYLVELSNRGGGSGVVYGFDVARGSGDEITIGGGLAFDGEGRTLYMPGSFQVALHDLIAATRGETTKAAPEAGGAAFERCVDAKDGVGTPTGPGGFYVITIAHAEDACGEEDVYGKLCEDACATSTDRPWLVEGVLVRAHEFRPTKPFPSSKVVQLGEKHVRSQLASAWFAQETGPTLISGAGLHSEAWCTGAPKPPNGEVAIAVLATLPSQPWVDEWIVRRERMETPPRRFWDWTMSMRPWAVYLAQILQFQCQLVDALTGPGGRPGTTDPCAPYHDALNQATKYFAALDALVGGGKTSSAVVPKTEAQPAIFLKELGGATRFQKVYGQLKNALQLATTPSDRILIDGGIVELPAAGYLPVTPGTTPPVEDQVQRLLGGGVDLRFCVVRHDYVAHALEEAQHMDRISLLTGLDDPTQKQQVDVYVPDAQIVEQKATQQLFFDAKGALVPTALPNQTMTKLGFALLMRALRSGVFLHGAARAERAGSNGAHVYTALAAEVRDPEFLAELFAVLTGLTKGFANNVSNLRESAPEATPTLTGRMAARLVSTRSNLVLGTPATSGGGEVVPHVAAWAEAHYADDPFHLTPGESTALDLVLDFGGQVVADGLRRTGVSAEVKGMLTVAGAPKVQGSTRTLETKFDGDATAIVDTQGAKKAHHAHLTGRAVTLKLEHDGSERRLEARFTIKSQTLVIEAVWGTNRPLEIALALVMGKAKNVSMEVAVTAGTTSTTGGVPIALLGGKEDASVADASSPIRQHALEAIDLVALATDDPTLAPDAKKKLFPDTGAGGRSLVATRDWVLFQRRRACDCGEAPPAKPVPVATRTYRVWEASTDAPTSVEFVVKAIETNSPNAIKRYKAHVVGDVEFTAGTANLVSDAAAVLADWKAAHPAAEIAYAAVATDLTDEPGSVLLARIATYEQAVASVSKRAANAIAKRLPALSSLPAAGADGGVLVFVTTKKAEVATVDHRVFAIRLNDNVAPAVAKLKQSRDLRAFIQTLKPAELGTVSFDLGTSTIASANLKKLADVQLGQLVDGLVVASLDTAPAGQPLDDQTDAIITKLNANKNFPSADKIAPVAASNWDYAEPFVTVLLMDFEA